MSSYVEPYIENILEWLSGKVTYHFIDGFPRCSQITDSLEDQLKTVVATKFDAFAYKQMSFKWTSILSILFNVGQTINLHLTWKTRFLPLQRRRGLCCVGGSHGDVQYEWPHIFVHPLFPWFLRLLGVVVRSSHPSCLNPRLNKLLYIRFLEKD